MNTYSKILITTLPLVFLLLLSTVGTTYYFWRSAFTELAETWLDTRLSEAIQVAAAHDAMLRRYGLETIPASIAKAKIDAGVAMSAIEVGKLGAIFAIDQQGTIAMHPDPAVVGRDVSQEEWFKDLNAQRSRLTHLTPMGRNLAMVDYFEPWSWYILASDPEREVYEVANRIQPYLLGLGIGGFMVMAVALMLLTLRLTQPLRLLTAGAEQIGKGDLDTRIAIRSRDEFGRLAQVFNQMTLQLRDTLTALQHREAHYRSLIENASDLIAILDEAGKISYVSPSIERILGHTRDAVVGRRVFAFMHPEDRKHWIQAFDQRIRSAIIESPPPSEIRIQHHNGSWRILEISIMRLLDHPAVQGLVVNARDVTQRKAVEDALQQSYQQLEDRVAERTAELHDTNRRLHQEIEEREQMSREKEKLQDQLLQAQKMKAIGTLAGGIAHDFNNLLMGIQGNAEIMALDTDPSDANGTRLKTILECVQSGARLTQQLLGFARLGKYQVTPTDINALVRQCTDMFGRTRQELRIVQRYEEHVRVVNVDRGQMEQVLLNLLINAWQAMPDGGNLYLETANEILDEHQVASHGAEPGQYVKITVRDTGTGIDPATLEQIFDPFFTTKTRSRGTGLSLASAYGIVRNHGGFIDVSSKLGRGTTFTIYLKATDAAPAKATIRPESAPGASGTILLVDDDPLILEVGKAMLSALGFDVLTAAGGKAALDIYREHGPRIALVILDMIMPDMGGGKTYDQLKAIDPGVSVLLSSGYSIDGQASAIMSRGCSGFIQKPFNLQSLAEKVNGILDTAN